MKAFFGKLKPLLGALSVSFAFGLMFFIEPITMYANNINDFWFDFSVIIGPTLLIAAIATCGLFVLLLICFLILKKLNKLNVYHGIVAVFIAGFIICYIHANFLSSMLPPLDGTDFEWDNTAANISSILVTLGALIATFFIIKKFKAEKTATYYTYTTLAIIAMLLVSFLSTVMTTDVFKAKEITTVSSTKNLNLMSTKNNFFIFMVDAVDARTFEDVLNEDGGKSEELKDFSFFKDSLSGYPFTRDSIPFILSGVWNENEKPYEDYSTEAYTNSSFFKSLNSHDYKVKNFYDNDFVWQNRSAFEFDNIESVDKSIKTKHFMTQELKYILFKTLPYPLKRFSKIKNMNYNDSKTNTEYEPFIWDDVDFYSKTMEQPAEKTDDKVFSYIHLEGAHVPHNLSKDVEVIDGGTDYYTKARATLTVIKKYINYLKDNGAYDNSTIIILADHGYDADGKVTGRQNPLLLVKNTGETHSKMHTSDKQVSYADLVPMYEDLLAGKKSTELFEGIAESGRERRYLYYVFLHEDHMVEQTTTGKAWETDKLTPTGKEYNL